ncbi:Mrp/NBP35 family ATP-binding protein [Halorubrum sp. Ib24]|uniref:Mrp/NBP35 family ATP-binding protein n=1 Tax=Halorubrum sp. Ib24 TaxID=1383850 RepID=UPI001F536B91|nr:Mrp/NBP35 family ATP-binding protein [Halorubrum sp. Ib24]
MAGFRCPTAGASTSLRLRRAGRLAQEHELPFLGGRPARTPRSGPGGDEGEPVVSAEGETADAFRVIVGERREQRRRRAPNAGL